MLTEKARSSLDKSTYENASEEMDMNGLKVENSVKSNVILQKIAQNFSTLTIRQTILKFLIKRSLAGELQQF